MLIECLQRVKNQADHYDGRFTPDQELKMIAILYERELSELLLYFEKFLDLRDNPANNTYWTTTEIELLKMIKTDAKRFQRFSDSDVKFYEGCAYLLPGRKRAAIMAKYNMLA